MARRERYRPFGQLGLRARITMSFTVGAVVVALVVILAAVVLIRLALNPYVLSYDANHALGSQCVLYGYGLPALAFYGAAWIFAKRARDHAVTVLESGAFVFALLLIALDVEREIVQRAA